MSDETPVEDTKPAVYVSKTDAELETLAQDIVASRVFHSIYNMPKYDYMSEEDGNRQAMHDLQSTFMVMALAGSDFFDALVANKIAVFYEYMDKAGPRSVNGRPVFFSLSMLNEEDQAKLHTKVLEIDAFLRSRQQAQGGDNGKA